jgi:hypothetical protein
MLTRLRSLEQLMPFPTAPGAIDALREMGGLHGGERVAGVLSTRELTGSLIERHEKLLRKLNEERVTLLLPYPRN